MVVPFQAENVTLTPIYTSHVGNGSFIGFKNESGIISQNSTRSTHDVKMEMAPPANTTTLNTWISYGDDLGVQRIVIAEKANKSKNICFWKIALNFCYF